MRSSRQEFLLTRDKRTVCFGPIAVHNVSKCVKRMKILYQSFSSIRLPYRESRVITIHCLFFIF